MKRAPFLLMGALACALAVAAGTTSVSTQAPGATATPAGTVPTYTKDIAPIIFKNCVTCHRPGEIAPMSLLSFQETRPWAKAIKDKVVNREMPPWHADPGKSLKFRNDRSLTQKQIDTIVAWVDGGAPKGDDAQMPKVPDVASGWMFDTDPDYIVAMPIEAELPAEGEIDNMALYVPSPFKEDVFVEKIEMRPGNKAIVHHETGWSTTLRDGIKIIDGIPHDLEGKPLNRDQLRPTGTTVFEAQPQMKLICYVPGRGWEDHRPGTAKRIRAGKNEYLQFDVHYQASGRPEKDRSRMGYWFSKVPVTHEVITQMVGGGAGAKRLIEGGEPPEETVTQGGVTRTRQRIPNIPPYADNWKITAMTPVMDSMTLYGLSPHMHLRGKDMKYVIVFPDGREETVLTVPKYDFNWQLFYDLEQPIKIPAGSKILAIGHYDNSLKNKSNPAPEKEVFWSEQSWDEMYEPYIEYTVDKDDLTKPARTQQQQQQQ